MIDFSLDKLLVVAVIALIVLGPEKLPAVARTAGAVLRRVRGGWDSVRAEVERELQVEEIRRAARAAAAQVGTAQAGLDAVVQGMQKPLDVEAIKMVRPAAEEGICLEKEGSAPVDAPSISALEGSGGIDSNLGGATHDPH